MIAGTSAISRSRRLIYNLKNGNQRDSVALHCYQVFDMTNPFDPTVPVMDDISCIASEFAHEVEKASTKFPTWPTDPLHAVAILGEEFGELTQATLQHTYEPEKSSIDDVRKEALQTAAMAFRFLLSIDEYKFQRGEQHSQS